jgi:DNA sulfur modification protein DndD
MLIQHIYAENYKTYLHLDLDISVSDDRPIILIGGANGGGKTTLFDAIYSALYGLNIETERQFRELFNAGVKDYEGKSIVLEISFTGLVLGSTKHYKMRRTYKIINHKPVENVRLDFDSVTYSFGSATPSKEKSLNEIAVNKIIDANLPKELSNYFLFDAMKTSDLVKEEEINNLIRRNINSVMGFNKYAQLEQAAEKLLSDEKAKRLEDEQQEKEYKQLVLRKNLAESELQQIKVEYDKALQYSNKNKDLYDKLKKGENHDALIKNKIEVIRKQLDNLKRSETEYKTGLDNIVKNLETEVIIPKLASVIAHEIEMILNVKDGIEESRKNVLNEKQISEVTKQIVGIIERKYSVSGTIDIDDIVDEIKYSQENPDNTSDKYYYLDRNDVDTLKEMLKANGNPMQLKDEQKRALDIEIDDEPKSREDLEIYRSQIAGNNYELIKAYEHNEQHIIDLKGQIDQKNKDIDQLKKKLQTYDYQVPQIPDPKYDLLCKLPQFFKDLSSRLLKEKKHSIETMMREYLNVNLVSYKGTIGKVDLSQNDDEIQFKMYHQSGNEIYLSQLNAGSKQMVMQVLLKVLYELGDYDPPVMIDTVMGVLDKAARETVLEHYFPDLAKQTILLSTDTEITTERDFVKLEPFISKVYTLHRDLDKQCTNITEDYFGLKLKEE